MNKIGLILLFAFFHLGGFGQNNYYGIVSDPGTQKQLDNVSVRYLDIDISTVTNDSGYFSIKSLKKTKSESNIYYFILDNTFYWNLDKNVEIKLFSISGNNLLTCTKSNLGILQLPILPIGYYILNIFSLDKNINLLLFSNGRNTQITQKKNFTIPISISDSILIFSKPDYYTRKITLNKEKELTVNILKKHYDSLDYFNELIRYEAFLMLQSSPPVTNYGEIQSIKAVYDFVDDKIYYSNVKKYPSHYSFAKKILGFKGSNSDFFHSQYGTNPYRFLNLVTINYHKNIDKYIFEFGSYDLIDCEGILNTYNKIIETSYLKDKLYFYPNNLKWKECPDIPMISSEEIYQGQNYQALNLEENYGFLKKIDIQDIENTYLGRHDIVLTNGIPNDLSVVSGIITTEFQTALSHINILSHNRNTPNMALRNGWDNTEINSLLGELVYLKVESDSFVLRKANIEEANNFWNKNEPQVTINLEKDINTSGLVEMNDADISWVKTIGGKAANFAELVKLNIPVPENYFAIPFYYYQQHIENNGIDTFINKLLADNKFISNIDYRKTKLKELRTKIKNSPIDQELANSVLTRINNFNNFKSFRFRSSTNAEDLENFNGAGLYDSYSAKKGSSKKTVANTIRKVWASLWNFQAFEEREYFKINHKSTAMGILVHRSFPDEDANGVIITKNLYNVNHGYVINVQYKEYSIVYPEPGILHDQIIVYTFGLDGKYTIEYLTKSNIAELEGKTVMSDSELFEIADYCTTIKKHYFYNLPNNCNCDYLNFAVDIEFKVDSHIKDRKIYIKQVRIYK